MFLHSKNFWKKKQSLLQVDPNPLKDRFLSKNVSNHFRKIKWNRAEFQIEAFYPSRDTFTDRSHKNQIFSEFSHNKVCSNGKANGIYFWMNFLHLYSNSETLSILVLCPFVVNSFVWIANQTAKAVSACTIFLLFYRQLITACGKGVLKSLINCSNWVSHY